MKRSSGVLHQAAFFTVGSSVLANGSNDHHCFALAGNTRSVHDLPLSFEATSGLSYGAPRSIHSAMRAIASAGSLSPLSGMCGSLAWVMSLMSWLSLLLPGTTELP